MSGMRHTRRSIMRTAHTPNSRLRLRRCAVRKGAGTVLRLNVPLRAALHPILGQLVDDGSQVAFMPQQRLASVGLIPSESEQYGDLNVALGALNKGSSIM